MNTYTKQKDGTIAVLIRNEWKPATTTRNKHGIRQALSADGKQWEDLPAAFQEQQAPAARDYQKPLGIPFTPGKIPDQVAPFPAYPGTTAQPGIKTTQPETEYQKSMGGLVSAGVKGLGSGFAVEAPRSAVNVASGAARINRSMLARLGYKTDQAKYEQELSQASALPAASARERMVKEGELERLKAGKPEEPIIEKVYNFVQELTEVTAEQPWLKADIENMTQMERDVYSGLRSLPVSLGAGAAGAVTVAAAGLTGVPLAVGAGVSTLVIMGLSAGEDFVRNWEKQAETDPKLKAIVEKLAKEENIPFDEAKQDMFDQMEINKKGVYYGLSEAIPEALGNLVMFWTAGFGKPLAAVIKTGARSVLKTGAKLIGAGSVEIGTELVTGTLQRGIEEKAGLPVEPMEKMLRDTFGSTLIMTIASAGLLKGTNLAMRYNMAEKAGIKPTDAPATMENIPDIPTTPEAKAQTSRELRRAANEIKASDPKRAEDIEIIAAFQENISDMSAEERADIVTSMMTRQGRTVAQGIVDKQNKLEQAHADIEKEKTTGRTDYLTKINSRRGLEAARTVDHTQAIIFDIDLFKKVNDTFGHPVGDVVLKDVADRAQAIAKKYGAAVGRIGGEEFVLLVPQGQDAAVISEEIRAEMEARPSEAFDKEVPFTVSVGYAPVDATGDAWATADKKMYEAKQAGRNQVMGVDAAPAEEGEGTLQKTSKFVSQAVEAGVDPEVAEATRILGEAFAKATGISVDKVLPQITTEAPGAGMLAQREAQINSPEFKKWFGKSQVVDKDGKPMVVYHGTYIKKDFDSFKPFSYFTDSPEGADSYTLRRLADKKIGYRPRIYPGYLSIENPLDLTHFGLDKNSLIPHNSGSLLNFLKTNESDLRNAILKTQSNPNFNTWRKEISGLPLFDESKDIPSKWVSDDVISAQHVWEQRGGLLPDAVLIGTRENINPVLGDILKNLGYDGIILPDYEVITSGKQGDYKQIKAFVNFSPTQIKSATGNRGTFSPTDANILHQEAQAAEPFYSKLRKVIADKMPNSATIEAINGLIAGAGVKNDELTWSGVKDFLEGKEKVSKAEMLDYLDKNPVEVKEITKNDDVSAWWSDEGGANEEKPYDELTAPERREALQRYRAEVDDYQVVVAKFFLYQLPGGENYREVLVTIPAKKQTGWMDDPEVVVAKAKVQEYEKTEGSEIGTARTEEHNKARSIMFDAISRAEAKARVRAGRFESAHYHEPNILYHLRLNDRTTADGKKMLFAEEIQSDWHQMGREIGYKGEAQIVPRSKTFEVIDPDGKMESRHFTKKEAQNRIDTYWWHQDNIKKGTPPIIKEAAKTPENTFYGYVDKNGKFKEGDITGNQNIADAKKNESGVPPAPFSKTWHEQAIKRMIRYAAENGYDGIGWTTGQQQFDRWGSEEIAWVKDGNKWRVSASIQVGGNAGGIDIEGEARARGLLSEEKGTAVSTKEQLRDIVAKTVRNKQNDYVGKLTDRIWGRMQTEDAGTSLPRKEGMERFYDSSPEKLGLVDFANKYTKKWGSGVEEKQIETGGAIHYLPITDAMRSDVVYKGQELLQIEDRSQKKPLPEAKEVSVDYVSETGDKYTEKLLEVPMESAYVREQRDQTTWTKWHKDLAKESKKEGPATSGRKFAYTSAGEVLVETGPKTDNRVPGVLSGDTERKSQMIVGLSSVEEINKYMDEIFGTEAELDAIQDAGRTTRKLELADIFRSDLEYAARERDIKSLMAGLAEIKYLFASDAKNHYTLFQKAGPAIQGAITFDAGKALIHVLKTANASTLPHELAHNFLKLGTEAKYFNDTEIKAMTDFGVLDKNGTITRPGQEKFARSFERYLRDGQSPSEHLKAIFDKFKAWLQEVYAQLQGSAIDIKLTPEIKGIFDRMLGVEARGEPATFLFWQENGQGEPVFPLYNLNVDIPGHGKGSTVSGETLKKAGIILPEPPKHGQMESPLITEAKEPWQMTRGEFIKIYKHPLADIKDIKINKLHRIKPLTESEIDRYDVLRISENSVEERAELHRLQNKEKGVIGLPEIIKSNELYKKYPFLKHVLVGFNNRITGMRATGNNIDVGRDAWKDSGLLLHEVIHVIQKESGIYSLTPPTKNVKTINDFTLAEEESWWNNPKEKEARSTQYILSGKYDNKIAGQSIHKSLIKQALASGKPVPAEVLAGYPDLKAKAQKPFTAPPRGEQTPQAAIPPKQGKIAQPAPVMQAPEGIQQDITAPKPEPSKIRNFFYGNYGATMPMPVEPLTRKRINKLAILDFVEKNFGVYVRDRATMKFEEGVAGKHYPEQHIIRLKFWGELEPMMHEIGHELNSKLGSVLGENWKKPFSKELGQMDYDKEQGRPEEGFAEFMRKYFTGDQTLEDTAPTFYDFFIQAIEKIPPWNTRINGLREQLDTWQQQGSDARFDAMIDPSPPVNLKQAVKDAWRKFYKMWVTAGEPFDYMEKQLKTAGIELEAENSPAKLRTYFNKKTKSKAYLWTFDGQYDPLDPSVKLGPSLSEIIIKAGIRSEDDLTKFVRYGTARRVMERYEAHGLEAGFDVNDAEYVKGKYQNSLWDAALDDITKWNGNLLRLYLLKPGLISEEQLTQIRAMNPMYLPMKRIMDNKERYGISSGKGLESGSGIKRVKGGSRPVMNFLKAMSEQMQGIMARGEKAYLGMSLINLEEQKPGLGIIVNVLAPTQVTRAHIDQAKVSFEKDGVQVAEKKLSETFNYDDVIEALTVQGIEATEGDLDAILTIFTQAPTYNGKDNIIPLWKEGKQKFYELNENLYSGISSMSAQYKWPFLEFVRKGGSMFSRALRLGATGLNAAFSLVTNPILRDPITYAIFSQKKFATPFDVIPTNLKRLGAFGGKTENMLRAERSGLGMSNFLGMDRNLVYDEILLRTNKTFYGKAFVKIRHPIEFFKEAFSWGESGPRLTEYENVYKQNLKDHPEWSSASQNIEATNAGQDVTVNFTRGSDAAFAINEQAAFFNVAIQGPEKLIRELKNNPVRTVTRGIAYLTIMGIWNYLNNRDKEWYENLPLSYRYNNLWWEVGGTVYHTPLPFELGTIFVALPCAAMETMRLKRPDDFKAAVQLFISQIPDPMPTLPAPLIDIMRNKDWLGNPIENEDVKRFPITERKKYYTTDVAAAASKGFNKLGIKLSPIQIDYLFNSWTGGITKNFPDLDIKETADIPIIGRYVLRMPENPRRQLEDYFTAEQVINEKDAFAKAIDAELTDAEEDRLDDIKNFRKSWTEYYAKDLIEYSSAMSTGDKTAHAKLVKTYREIREHLSDIGFK